MKLLKVFDDNNYSADMPIVEKYAARGIILRDGKIAVQKGRVGDCKILGGGIEPSEDAAEALYREILEEAGLFIVKDTIRNLGTITELREDLYIKGIKYVCHTAFYLCDIEDRITDPHMTASEIEKGYHLEWITPDDMIQQNTSFLHQPWIKRDTAFVQMLVGGKLDI